MGRGLRRFFEFIGPAALAVVFLASSITYVSATIVTVAGDSAVGKNSLAMPGSQDILKDTLGKYVAFYVDVGGNLSVVYANGDPTQAGAWSAPAKSPMPLVAYRRPAAVFTSPISMRIIAEGGPDGVAEPAAFASFNTFTYAVLSVQDALLTVRIVGHPGAEFPVLLVPTVLADYANTPSHTILQFKVQGA